MQKNVISEKVFYNYIEDIFYEFKYGDVFIVDHGVLFLNDTLQRYLKDKKVIIIDSLEENKNLYTVNRIYDFLLKNGESKRIIAIGGGIVGDIAGYAAATFKRGIPYINIPTTLIAMCDSSIGGKTGVNYKGIKNYIGTFKTPDRIIFCFEFLESLQKREIKSGVGELIKYGLIGDKEIIDILLEKTIDNLTIEDIKVLITKGVNIKESFVKLDYFDTNVRNALNFGHSIGHGVEMLSEKILSHGEAVSLGIIVELRLSELKYNLDSKVLDKVKCILSNFEIGMKTKITSIEELISLIYKDKKNDEFLRFTLLKNIEDPVVQVKISEKDITDNVKEILE